MDTFAAAKRSEIMRSVRSRGTAPELRVRAILRSMRISYRSCASNLPGKPDIVLPKLRKAIFVHGCFWHGHSCEAGGLPKTNRAYWKSKQARNAIRDSRNSRALRSKGWRTMVIWECEVRQRKGLESRLDRFARMRP